ncbi:SDR family oxidoreductase [Deinococcus sp. KSM4-11]|uniref:SDR family NAD(P)-dependent oxidoreductase n=1 Tax=Deinococcus sp. KSM4-11 TaxID=2568654 RepID=UPI0010A2CBAF|nr:SDR family oxidoreductase [Deinococcus sp. KSM4-11]THF86530.1 SDR family oxidoreductase [Deinococcus sp. KSM4-11]
MDLGLTGKVAVVTGGSVGIGLAVARGLAAEGVHLAVCARDAARLSDVAAAIRADFGVRVLPVSADVAVAADIDRLVGAVQAEFGGADILFNNAGTGSEETILSAPDEKWQHYWDLHVMAAVRLARSLAPLMAARGGGVILNNASICATQPLGYEPIYNVTKAALVMFSKCLANELIPQGIRVNTLNPGLVRTPDWEKTARILTEGQAQTWEQYLQNIADENAPIGRFATPEEIADFAVFLCSPRASYSVGSTYYVDGGWLRVTT